MNSIFKFILFSFVVFVSLLALSGCVKQEKADLLAQIKEKRAMVVGVKYDTKPFGFEKNGSLQGFDVDLAREISRRLVGSVGAVSFRKITPANRIYKLTSKEVDMVIATMSITNTRKKIVDFSIPYYATGLAIMVNKQSNIKFAQDLVGRRTAIIAGSTAEKSVKRIIPATLVKSFSNYKNAYYALKNNQVEAVVGDDAILTGFFDDKTIKFLPGRFSKELYGVAFRKGEENANLKNAVNIIIEEMKMDGTLKSLQNKWVVYSS